jgi:hypothetical protein
MLNALPWRFRGRDTAPHTLVIAGELIAQLVRHCPALLIKLDVDCDYGVWRDPDFPGRRMKGGQCVAQYTTAFSWYRRHINVTMSDGALTKGDDRH